MSIWTVMNGAAWALCAFFAYLIISDLIKVERKNAKEQGNDSKEGNELGGVKDGRTEE